MDKGIKLIFGDALEKLKEISNKFLIILFPKSIARANISISYVV